MFPNSPRASKHLHTQSPVRYFNFIIGPCLYEYKPSRAMPKQCHKHGLHTMVLPECSFRKWLQAENEAWYSSDTAFQTYMVHRRLLNADGDLVALPVRAIAIFMKHGVAMRVTKCVKWWGPSRFECRTSRGWTTYGWTCKAVGHKHMEIQVNKYGFLTEIPINSWLLFYIW